MDKYVTRAELEEALNLSPRGLDSWIAREGLQAFRLSGRSIRFRLDEVEAALARAASRAPTPASGEAALDPEERRRKHEARVAEGEKLQVLPRAQRRTG